MVLKCWRLCQKCHLRLGCRCSLDPSGVTTAAALIQWPRKASATANPSGNAQLTVKMKIAIVTCSVAMVAKAGFC